jgi:transposase-like protein
MSDENDAPRDSFDPNRRLDPDLQRLDMSMRQGVHGGAEDEFFGLLGKQPGETEVAYEALMAVARLRPHQQLSLSLAEQLEISGNTLRHWRSQHSWNARLAAFNDARAAYEHQQTVSLELEARSASKNLAVKLASLIGERLTMMTPDEITPVLIPQYVQALSRMIEMKSESEVEDANGLLDIAELAGLDDGADQIMDLADLNPELAEKVISVFSKKK